MDEKERDMMSWLEEIHSKLQEIKINLWWIALWLFIIMITSCEVCRNVAG